MAQIGSKVELAEVTSANVNQCLIYRSNRRLPYPAVYFDSLCVAIKVEPDGICMIINRIMHMMGRILS